LPRLEEASWRDNDCFFDKVTRLGELLFSCYAEARMLAALVNDSWGFSRPEVAGRGRAVSGADAAAAPDVLVRLS
jgi:hypothetical protein